MDFTFIRAQRSQEENQERAFIAASRRQDREFSQRLDSLQKASELHFARTGKKFVVTQSQVTHNGPLIELGEENRRKRRRVGPQPVESSTHDRASEPNTIQQVQIPSQILTVGDVVDRYYDDANLASLEEFNRGVYSDGNTGESSGSNDLSQAHPIDFNSLMFNAQNGSDINDQYLDNPLEEDLPSDFSFLSHLPPFTGPSLLGAGMGTGEAEKVEEETIDNDSGRQYVNEDV
jgi:hypothetical protein